MFRITEDPSSGSLLQILAKNDKNDSIVSVDMDKVGVMAAYSDNIFLSSIWYIPVKTEVYSHHLVTDLISHRNQTKTRDTGMTEFLRSAPGEKRGKWMGVTRLLVHTWIVRFKYHIKIVKIVKSKTTEKYEMSGLIQISSTNKKTLSQVLGKSW